MINRENAAIRKRYLEAQQQDPLLMLFRKRFEAIRDGQPFELQGSAAQRNALERYPNSEFSILHDLLYHIHPDKRRNINLEQLCVPVARREEILRSLHDSQYGGGHLAVGKCWEKLKNRYWWPGAYKDVQKWVKECAVCQYHKSRPRTAALQPNIRSSEPWEAVAVDVLGPLPRTRSGYTYIIVFIDLFTSWVEAFPMKSQDAETCARCLVNGICCRYGPPSRLLSDRGSNFLSSLAQNVNAIMNIKKLNTTAYHPQTNGKVERFNNTLVKMLVQYVSAKGTDWDEFIPSCLYSYNTSRHELNGFSPYYMLYGHEARDVLTAMVRVDSDQFLSATKYGRKIIRRLRRAHRLAMRNQREVDNRYLAASLAKPPETFEPGDLVLLRSPRYAPGSQKFQSQWHGPYAVTRKTAAVTYEIKVPNQSGPRSHSYLTHVNRLRRFHPRAEADESQLEPESIRDQILVEEQERTLREEAIVNAADRAEAATASLATGTSSQRSTANRTPQREKATTRSTTRSTAATSGT